MLGMNAHALGVRHDLILGEGNRLMRDMGSGIDAYLADSNDSRCVPIVNLQCDIDHPTQCLADAAWLRERFPGGMKGRRVAVSWAYSPSNGTVRHSARQQRTPRADSSFEVPMTTRLSVPNPHPSPATLNLSTDAPHPSAS